MLISLWVFSMLDIMGCYVEWVAFLFLFLNTMLRGNSLMFFFFLEFRYNDMLR